MSKRDATDYRSQRLDEGLTVLEELLNAPTRGYTCKEISDKTGIAYDKCYRALHTFLLRGYARQFIGAWKPGDRCRVFAARVDLAVAREQDTLLHAFHDEVAVGEDVVALANSMREF